MKTFSVYEIPGQEEPVFVKEGFSWFGFILPWLAALRFSLFRYFIFLCAYTLLLLVCVYTFPMNQYHVLLLWGFIHLFSGAILFDLWGVKLEGKGGKLVAVLIASSSTEAQLRFYDTLSSSSEDEMSSQSSHPPSNVPAKSAGTMPSS